MQDRFALDLRVAKIQYYTNNNEESVQPLLAHVAQLHTNPQLQYEYHSFIGQVFKSAKNFEKLNDYESAYRYLYEAHGLSKTIAKNTLDKNIHAIEAKYNVVKQQEKTLKEKNKRLEVQLFLYGALFLIVMLIIFALLLYIRNKAYKKRFEELMSMHPNRTVIKALKVPEKINPKKRSNPPRIW